MFVRSIGFKSFHWRLFTFSVFAKVWLCVLMPNYLLLSTRLKHYCFIVRIASFPCMDRFRWQKTPQRRSFVSNIMRWNFPTKHMHFVWHSRMNWRSADHPENWHNATHGPSVWRTSRIWTFFRIEWTTPQFEEGVRGRRETRTHYTLDLYIVNSQCYRRRGRRRRRRGSRRHHVSTILAVEDSLVPYVMSSKMYNTCCLIKCTIRAV